RQGEPAGDRLTGLRRGARQGGDVPDPDRVGRQGGGRQQRRQDRAERRGPTRRAVKPYRPLSPHLVPPVLPAADRDRSAGMIGEAFLSVNKVSRSERIAPHRVGKGAEGAVPTRITSTLRTRGHGSPLPTPPIQCETPHSRRG